jgi:hypothetical protein
MKMSSSGILRRVALVRTEVSEGRMAFIIMEKRISELGTTSAITSSLCTLRPSVARYCQRCS